MSSRNPRRFRRPALFALAFAIAVLTQISALAQTDQGRIVGTVTDANGAIVLGANVAVKNERTGEERSTVTNQTGYYIIASLKPSTYTVTAAANNLMLRLTNVRLLVGQELNLGLTLQPTGVEAKVDISATGDTGIETGSASMSVNVNPREVALGFRAAHRDDGQRRLSFADVGHGLTRTSTDLISGQCSSVQIRGGC